MLNCPCCEIINTPKPSTKIFKDFICKSCKNTYYYLECTCNYKIISKIPFFYGEKINCSVCKKTLNLVPCPMCKEINMWEGDYSMGSLINCCSCKVQFQHVACPFCLEPNFWISINKNVYKIGVIVQCCKCDNHFQQVVCPECFQPCYFYDCDYKDGMSFNCDSCKKTAYHITCPQCDTQKYFKKDVEEFYYGKIYHCEKCYFCYSISLCCNCFKLNKITIDQAKKTDLVIDFKCKNTDCDLSEYKVFFCEACKKLNYISGLEKEKCSDLVCIYCKKTRKIFNCKKCLSLELCSCSKTPKFHKCNSCEVDGPKSKEILQKNIKHNSKKELLENGFCIIDYVNKINCAFFPCGHACICYDCYLEMSKRNVEKCPLCNEKRSCVKLVNVGY